MKVINLFSGSKGNSTYVSCGRSTVLVDAGGSCKAICKALSDKGQSIESVKAVLITHEHCDHVAALRTLLKKRSIPVYIDKQSADRIHLYDAIPTELIRAFPDEITLESDEMKISSFRSNHDSVRCHCYRIDTENDSLGIITDTGCIGDDIISFLSGCRKVIMEANHDIDMLRSGPYPKDLQDRISSDRGHLSNEQCGHAAKKLQAAGLKYLMLAHISEENNTPEAAFRTVSDILSGCGVSVCISSQCDSTEFPDD